VFPDGIFVIDEDQGKSGATAEDRLGFQRLLAEVSLDHVGLILGLEMSRLARSCNDWHQLLELCALFRTVLVDQYGLYDPNDHNDRLPLGSTGLCPRQSSTSSVDGCAKGCSKRSAAV
jgi:DNA invertase Pin-like site-specific DNA recombinase